MPCPSTPHSASADAAGSADAVHFPDSQEKLNAARERLAFDEIFYLQMGVLRQKIDWKSVEARRFPSQTSGWRSA